jgi:hypothetical protein
VVAVGLASACLGRHQQAHQDGDGHETPHSLTFSPTESLSLEERCWSLVAETS